MVQLVLAEFFPHVLDKFDFRTRGWLLDQANVGWNV